MVNVFDQPWPGEPKAGRTKPGRGGWTSLPPAPGVPHKGESFLESFFKIGILKNGSNYQFRSVGAVSYAKGVPEVHSVISSVP